MRDVLKSSVRRGSVGLLWALVLLVLPNCTFNPGVSSPGPNLSPGAAPHSSAIFCDIEKPLGRHCATDTDKARGIRLASAALALAAGQTSNIGLDDSPDALARCGGGPEAVIFQGRFPEGYSVCVNCPGAIGTVAQLDPNPDANKACVAQCEDFFGTTQADGTLVPDNPPDPSVSSFCQAHAHASTNFPLNDCFADACTTAGSLRTDFADPRRIPEPVIWQDLIGVSASGGSLARTAASTAMFDAGADSSQVIDHGDGYVEFTATETDKTRLCGLSSGAPPDAAPGFADIGFAIDLFSNGQISIFESGQFVQTFGTYAPGDRLRVTVRDNFNHTATVSYSKIIGPCTPGTPCNESVFFTSSVAGSYPFRVDSSFFEQGATLTDVRLVRIH